MKLFISALSFALALSTQALAQNRSSFDTLRESFNNATEPAKIADFETANWKDCLFVDAFAPMQTRATKVRVLDFPGSGHDQGPLFPDGDHRVDVFNDFSIDGRLDAFFAYSRVDATDTYFVQSLRGGGWNSVNTYGRKQDGMLFFSVEMSDRPQGPLMTRVYGYCWATEDQGGGDLPLPTPH
jgi:hypothetical protein